MRILIFTCFLFLSNFLFAQKVLQLEKYGSAKVKKFYIGDELTYRIAGDKTWYQGTIQDLKIEENIILFEDRFVYLKDITKLRKYRHWTKGLFRQSLAFAGGWLFFSLAGTLVGWELTLSTIVVPGATVAVTWITYKLFYKKNYKLGKRRWLRMLDLTMVRPAYGP